jgi:Tol biopolymer transport system component
MRVSRIHPLIALIGPLVILVASCDDPVRPPQPGAIRVTVAASGTDVTHGGYRVSVDNGPAQSVDPVTTRVTFFDLEPGLHTVQLEGLQPNCTVVGQNPMSVTVVSDQAALVQFNVTCVANVGTVRVTTVTTGGDPDANGYTAMVDGVRRADVGAGAAVSIAGVGVGGHVISLGDVASNCTVRAPHPVTANVVFNQTVDVAFAIQCVGTGNLEVTVTTTGVELDPDGYTVNVYGYTASFSENRPIGPNGSVVFSGLRPTADYHVTLHGLSANCRISGSATQTVAVTEGNTTRVAYAVSCGATGSLEVIVATTGVDLDPDGYAVNAYAPSVPYSQTLSVAPNGSVTFSGIPAAADYHVSLQGLSVNCSIVGSPTQTVAVVGSTTTRVAFTVSCQASRLLAFVREGDIYVIGTNGTGLARLTTQGGGNSGPAWSNRGQIAFTTTRHGDPELYVMNENGTNPMRLTTSADTDDGPSWSPDGTKLVFRSVRAGNSELYVMNADGSGVTRLTTSDADEFSPAWSSTGKIVFVSNRDHVNGEIYVMNEDGSNVVRLTNNIVTDSNPAWSPDGSMIAFARQECSGYWCGDDIFVMNADGSNQKRMATGWGLYRQHLDPAWMPNGSAVSFTLVYCDSYYGCSSPSIWLADVQGADVRFVLDNAADAAWKP